MLRNKRFDCLGIRCHSCDALWQSLNAVKLCWPTRLTPKRFHNGGGKLDGQGSFQHDHRHTCLLVLTRHLDSICGVGIDMPKRSNVSLIVAKRLLCVLLPLSNP